MRERIFGFKPFIYPQAQTLILGSMPSVASLEQGFYYAHKQNRLWKIVGKLAGIEDLNLKDVEEKKKAALKLKLSFFDVIASCEREGSLDSAIKNPKGEDIKALLDEYPNITKVIVNGGLAKKLFLKFNKLDELSAQVFFLPSTSAANAAMGFDKLFALYSSVILNDAKALN